MGETLRVKAGEDAIKRVQQGFDKVAKEKQMNGYVIILIIIIITRPWPAFGRQGLDGLSGRYNSNW